ncbi:CrcB family protein [Microbacterium hydrocarbonoxydans]|uniref:CrcB family protein n=1 Tax=Microbacterium hydrocarbonoxydans TaxID=273678 RepID=UPI0007BBAD8A|nr:CrcB family protein [Microbacterium hydrocarbonoxydans]GAT74379.1 protein CrcB homolog [Microbacterium sp. HM58-2]
MNLTRVLLVAAGGTAGTAARLGLGLLLPDAGVLPVLLANILGALLIGILTARLPKATGLRLLLGTGLLGGFTTYSAFMTGTVGLWADAPLLAVGYALGSLALGLGAAALGLRIGRPHAEVHPTGGAA